MSLTYGYDLKEGDDMIAAPLQVNEMLIPYLLPGASMVNHLPFRAVVSIIVTILVLTDVFSEIHPPMDALAQLWTIGTDGQEAE